MFKYEHMFKPSLQYLYPCGLTGLVIFYLSFSPYLQTGGTLEVKTIAIISFALCGFANFGSIGVVVGAFSAISPKRAPEIAQLGLRALAAATLSNLMSATIAGFFIGLA